MTTPTIAGGGTMPTPGARSQPLGLPTEVKVLSAEQVRDEMKHVFDRVTARACEIYQSNGRRIGSDLQNWYRAECELLYPVQVDVFETGEAFAIRAELPGFKAKELRIGLEPRRFVIAAERKPQRFGRKKTRHSTQSRNYLFYSEYLCGEVIPANARATLQAGILRLELTKAAATQKSLSASAGAGAP